MISGITAADSAAVPTRLEDALALLREDPGATVVAGGTDVMVGVNEGTTEVRRWISLRRVEELSSVDLHADGSTRIGATVTMARLVSEVADRLPALASAARTVGGPQIRSAATIGGNLSTGSPAGDTLTPLLACGAEVELASAGSTRRMGLDEFLVGPKRTARRSDELLVAVHVPAVPGPQVFAKVGPRGAMVIAVCNLAARLDTRTGAGCVAVGSVAPTVLRIDAAAESLADPTAGADFARVVAEHVRPIDDVRSSADYRTHAVGVLARRVHSWLHDATGTP